MSASLMVRASLSRWLLGPLGDDGRSATRGTRRNRLRPGPCGSSSISERLKRSIRGTTSAREGDPGEGLSERSAATEQGIEGTHGT